MFRSRRLSTTCCASTGSSRDLLLGPHIGDLATTRQPFGESGRGVRAILLASDLDAGRQGGVDRDAVARPELAVEGPEQAVEQRHRVVLRPAWVRRKLDELV